MLKVRIKEAAPGAASFVWRRRDLEMVQIVTKTLRNRHTRPEIILFPPIWRAIAAYTN
jgi:hypothetical protein